MRGAEGAVADEARAVREAAHELARRARAAATAVVEPSPATRALLTEWKAVVAVPVAPLLACSVFLAFLGWFLPLIDWTLRLEGRSA